MTPAPSTSTVAVPVLSRPAPAPAASSPRSGHSGPTPPKARRDVALDLLRGLAVVILVVNHIHLDSPLELGTEPFLSAAEALVLVSGIVSGIVFRRRWETEGAYAATLVLLRRSRTLYVASVAVVAIVAALRHVPGLSTEALTIAPGSGIDLYAVEGTWETLVAIATLAVGPWQFDVLGFFIAVLALTPVVLWALHRGGWAIVLTTSVGLYMTGRLTLLEVLPSLSERPFPLLVWQVLFVPGVVLGWHRDRVEAVVRARLGLVVASVATAALGAAYLRLHEIGLDPLGLDGLIGYGPADWAAWDRTHFDKRTLDPVRLASMVAFTSAAYLLLRGMGDKGERTIGRLLAPLGRNSFYVFILQVFICLGVASVPALAGEGIGPVGNAMVQVGCLALLWLMIRRRFLFRWVPR